MRILTRICWTAFLLASLRVGATAQTPTGIASGTVLLPSVTASPDTVEGSPSATIVGTVTLTAADGSTSAGDGARVALACGADATRTEVADDHGGFRFLNVPVDNCLVQADVQGFAAQPVMVVTAAAQVAATDLHLGIRPLGVGVTVGGSAPFQEPKILRKFLRSAAGRRLERSAKWCTG